MGEDVAGEQGEEGGVVPWDIWDIRDSCELDRPTLSTDLLRASEELK
jgi:hypothetical protein